MRRTHVDDKPAELHWHIDAAKLLGRRGSVVEVTLKIPGTNVIMTACTEVGGEIDDMLWVGRARHRVSMSA